MRVHITKSSAAASPCSPGVETPLDTIKQSIVVEELNREIASLEKEIAVEKIMVEKKEAIVTDVSDEVLPPSAVTGRPNVLETVSRVVGDALESEQVLVAGTTLLCFTSTVGEDGVLTVSQLAVRPACLLTLAWRFLVARREERRVSSSIWRRLGGNFDRLLHFSILLSRWS